MLNIFCRAAQTTLLICVLFFIGARAATLTVDNTSDNAALTACTAAANDCSLRGAIAAASSGDTVTFDSGLFMTPRLIRLTGGNLVVNKNLTVTGVGGVIIDGNRTDRVFFIQSGTVGLSGMTVTGGFTSASGGGIGIAAGTVTLTNMVVTGNTSTSATGAAGGGISNSGTLNVVNSTVSDNAATQGRGGGISNSGTLNVTNSTISGNMASNVGGGISLESNVLAIITNSAIVQNTGLNGGGLFAFTNSASNITNSTISNNGATGAGGGILACSGTWTNVTIADNSANENGGGVFIPCSSVNPIIRNSLIARNVSPSDPDIFGAFISQGNNLVQTRGSSTGYISSDLPNGTNPLLGVLKNNGGLSATHALLSGSPAIDAGNNAFAVGPTDQRGPGFARIVNFAVDIGAFEVQGRGCPPAQLICR